MRVPIVAYLAFVAVPALAADPPPADAEFRDHYVASYSGACVKGLEAKPELKALYSSETVVAYCECRQRYKADVLAQAIKDERRGKQVQEDANEYAQAKCAHILEQQLDHE